MSNLKGKYDFLLLILSLSLISLTIGFSAFIGQSDFAELLFFYGFFFVVYLLIYSYVELDRTVYWLLGLGLLLRLITVFLMPNLSDDVYRFIWDGRLLMNGYSPFAELPTYYIEQGINIPGIDRALFDQLNSPNYFTVYPPVPQGIFAGAVWCVSDSIQGSVIAMKLVFLYFEIGTLILLVRLLQYFSMPLKNALLYALNPLIILDTFTNLHFEIAMIFFLLLAVWLLVKQLWQFSAIAMALAICSKLLPLMFLPFFIRYLGWKRAVAYFAFTGGLVLLLFFPFFDLPTITHFGESLNLYFQRFEFNASVYYMLRWVGYQIRGHNIIQVLGPILAALTVLWILWYALLRKSGGFKPAAFAKQERQLLQSWLFAMTLFLLLTTTIHPWYLSSIIMLAVFSRFRYPILWSGLIMLTYINYSYASYSENLWIVGLEYSCLFGFMIWEQK